MKSVAALIAFSMVSFVASADVRTPFDPRPVPDARLFGAYVKASSRPALYYSTREEYKPHGRVLVQVQTPTGWAPAGEISEDQFLRAQSIDVSRWSASGEVTIKLAVDAPGAAHVDSLLVNGVLPLGLDARLVRKLGKTDNDIVSYSEVAGRPLTFKTGTKALLTIVGRIEAAVIGTEPVAFPVSNTYKQAGEFKDFYPYRVGSHPWSPTIDGSILGEQLGNPLFKETFPLGSGHPESPIYGWIGDDGTYFYAVMDVTGDNTLDGTKDYAKVYAKTREGVREFKITTAEERWGKAGFQYTDKVAWEHKVYEFAIPLAEIAPAGSGPLQLAFAAYGTLAAPDINYSTDVNGVDPDAGSSGTAFTFTVVYKDGANLPPTRSDVWIDINGDGLEGAGPLAIPFGGIPPATLLIILAAAGMAISLTSFRWKLGRAALVVVAAATLWACPPKTTQEVYPMTAGGANWNIGVVMTAAVPLTLNPGTYNFKFLYKDSLSANVTGPASGQLHVTVN